METIVQRLERLYTTDNWTQNDRVWLAEYLKGDISELYLIALDGFSKDVLENKMMLSEIASHKILKNIHQNLQMPKQRVITRKLVVIFTIAASVASIVLGGYLFRKQLDNWIDPVKYEEVVTAKGEVKTIELADGTSIWLNADSKIIYPDKFKGDTREITLFGEAYFNVAHDVNKRFIIHTDKVNTEVLGTSFNIKAYTEDATIKVAVVTGKVGVVAKSRNIKQAAILLTPNMQAVYTKTNKKLVSETIDNASSISEWYQGKLHYHNTPLPEVLADLQRKYNVEIKADNNLLSCTLYADFNNLSLQKILKLMEALINAHAVKEGNGYRLKGKGCS